MKHFIGLAGALVFCCAGLAQAQADSLDLRTAQGSGVYVLENFAGGPDLHGVMKTFSVEVPAFEKLVYYQSLWWPAGGNRVRPWVYDDFTDVAEGGLFALFKLRDGGYLALLPIGGADAYTWFDAENGRLLLKLGTHGAEAIAGDYALYAWARGEDPYAACHAA